MSEHYSADVHARALRAMDRREAGLCDLCDRQNDSDEHGTCSLCRGLAEMEAEWPPRPATRREWAARVLAGLGLTLAATAFCMPPGLPGLGVCLSALLACSMCAVMELLARRKPEATGTVTSREPFLGNTGDACK